MKILYQKQQDLLSEDELRSVLLFYNIESVKTLKQNNVFRFLRKSKKHQKLYQKLLKISRLVSPLMAEKFFVGYLEYKKLKAQDLIE